MILTCFGSSRGSFDQHVLSMIFADPTWGEGAIKLGLAIVCLIQHIHWYFLMNVTAQMSCMRVAQPQRPS